MATGSTFNSGFRRDQIIAGALKKVAKSRKGGYSMAQIDDAISALNKIIRSESTRGDSKIHHFWALSDGSIVLTANTFQYSLEEDVLNIRSIVYRNRNGEDTPIDLKTHIQWNQIATKNEAGDVVAGYFKQNIELDEQVLYVHPAPSSLATPSEVLGTDGLNYTCILKHTAAAVNCPVTGASYAMYWKQAGASGSAWVTATAYVNSEALIYVYERPLYDFTRATDNPDMPAGWENYLIHKLAYDLSPDYRLPLDERKFLEYRVGQELQLLHPDARKKVTDAHNKAKFF